VNTSASPRGAASAAPSASHLAGATVPARCHTSQLSAAIKQLSGAASHRPVTVVLTNTSQTPCTLNGYPGFGLLDANRHALPAQTRRGAGPLYVDHGPITITVLPGQHASTTAEYTTGGNPGTCQSAAYVEITPPNERDFLLVGYGLTMCDATHTISTAALVGGNAGTFKP